MKRANTRDLAWHMSVIGGILAILAFLGIGTIKDLTAPALQPDAEPEAAAREDAGISSESTPSEHETDKPTISAPEGTASGASSRPTTLVIVNNCTDAVSVWVQKAQVGQEPYSKETTLESGGQVLFVLSEPVAPKDQFYWKAWTDGVYFDENGHSWLHSLNRPSPSKMWRHNTEKPWLFTLAGHSSQGGVVTLACSGFSDMPIS